MTDCFFCGAFVGEINGDGGVKGRTIGGRDICEQCLGELKYHLESITAKSPSEREEKLTDEDNEDDSEEIKSSTSNDPFSSSPMI
jgi:hypothetical protein